TQEIRVDSKTLIQHNLDVVMQNAPDLTTRFYGALFRVHPELPLLFGRRSAEAQGRMLLEAVVAVVDHLQDMPWLDVTLRALGKRHVEFAPTHEMSPLLCQGAGAPL